MAYTVYKNDGSVLTIISIGEIDDLSTSLTLLGKNVNNYGEILNNNFVKLLTNFSNDTPPVSAQEGQLWFDTSNNRNRLKVYDGESWRPVFAATTTTLPDPSLYAAGDLWFDPTNKQLNVLWSQGASELGKTWILVGPAVNPDEGKFGILPPDSNNPIMEFISNNTQKQASVVRGYTKTYQILSPTTFVIDTSTNFYYTNSTTTATLYSGTTILNNLTIKKDLYIDGNVNIRGELVAYPDRSLSSFYDITRFGNPEKTFIGTLTDTSTRLTFLNTSNNAIVADLKKLFPLDSSSTYDTKGYALNSEAKVLCLFNNTLTSVRRFILREIVPGVKSWAPLNNYYNTLIGEMTNIVVNPDRLPPSFIVQPSWSPSLIYASTLSTATVTLQTLSTLSWVADSQSVAATVDINGPRFGQGAGVNISYWNTSVNVTVTNSGTGFMPNDVIIIWGRLLTTSTGWTGTSSNNIIITVVSTNTNGNIVSITSTGTATFLSTLTTAQFSNIGFTNTSFGLLSTSTFINGYAVPTTGTFYATVKSYNQVGDLVVSTATLTIVR